MKKYHKHSIVGILTLLGMLLYAPLQSQSLESYHLITSAGDVNVNDFYIEESTGNMYLIGNMDDDITFSRWGANRTLADNDNSIDFYYAASSNTSGIQFIRRISILPSQENSNFINKLAVTDDFVYILGSFAGSLSIYDEIGNMLVDETGNTAFFSNVADADVLLIKINKSTGALTRVYNFGGDGRDFGDYITVDNDDNIIVSGRFNGTADFQINKTFNFPFFPPARIEASNGNDLFVVKYDSDDNDLLLDFQNIGGDDDQNKTLGIVVNEEDEVFITGRFHRQVTIGTVNQTTTRSNQVFVSKLNSNLNPVWLKLLEDDSDANTQVTSMAFDEESERLFVVGRVQGNTAYDNAALSTPTIEDNNLLVLKVSGENGNLVGNSHIYGGNGYQDGKQIVFDGAGNYYLTGTYYNELTITTYGLSKRLNNQNVNNTFFAAFNKNDHIVFLNSFVNTGDVFSSKGMFLFEAGDQVNVHAVLNFDSNVDVGLGESEIITNNSGTDNGFIGKYQFNKIPVFNNGSLLTDDGSFDIFYTYETTGSNITTSNFTSRFLNRDAVPTDDITPFLEGETLIIGVPTNIVAGTSYRLQLDFEEYSDIHPFTSFSVPPDIHPFEDPVTVVAGDNLNIPGRYFGNQNNGVSVSLVREVEGSETVVSAPVNTVAPNVISISIPQAYPGAYQVRVTVNGEITDGDNLTINPQLTQLTPSENTPGGDLTILGSTFIDSNHSQDLLEVKIIEEGNAENVISIKTFTSVEAGSIKLVLPLANAIDDGTYLVEVVVDGLVSNPLTLTIEDTTPVVNSLQPTSGLPGDEITISGLNLGATTVIVKINDVNASVLSASATEVKATVPTLEPGTYEVVLSLDGIDYPLSDDFTITKEEPDIDPLSKTSGFPGEEIVISGLNLGATTVVVKINGIDATVISSSDTEIRATIPALDPGTYQAVLSLDDVEYILTDSFVITAPPAGIAITTIDPKITVTGNTLTVKGSNLDQAANVSVGDSEASFEKVDNSTLTLTVPDLFPGSYPIKISGTEEEEAVIYESLTVTHSITNLSETEISSSSDITISGSNFRSAVSPPDIQVLLNDVALENVSVNVAGTEITFTFAVTEEMTDEEFEVKVVINGISVTAEESITFKKGDITDTTDPEVSILPDRWNGNEVSIAVQATDNETGITKVEVAFAGIMDDTFGDFQEVEFSEDRYSFSSSAGDELGVKYQFRVTNGAGTSIIVSNETFRSYALGIGILPSRFADAPGQEDYRIVAVPFEQQSVNQALGNIQYKKEDWRLFRLNSSGSGENAYQEFNAGFSQFKPGEGYWLIAKNGILDSIQGDVAKPNEEGNILIPVNAGWNLIGNPYPFNIDWNVVKAANPDMFLDEARLSKYKGGQTYVKNDNNLEDYEGAFVNIKDAGNLLIPFTAKAPRINIAKEKTGIVSIDASVWQIDLSVQASEDIQQNLRLGMHHEAKFERDYYDADIFPSFFGSSTAYFTREGISLETDIIPPSSFAEWAVVLTEKVVHQPVVLHWDNQKWKNNQYQLWLYNEVTQQVVDMQATQSYQFYPNESEQILKVLYGKEKDLLQYVLPSTLHIGKVYPNPVTTDHINLSVLVPIDQETSMRWELLDMRGRVVKHGAISLHAGIHHTAINVNEQQGLYFLKVISSEGRTLTQQKIILKQ